MAEFSLDIVLFAVEGETFCQTVKVEDPELSDQTVQEISANQSEVTS